MFISTDMTVSVYIEKKCDCHRATNTATKPFFCVKEIVEAFLEEKFKTSRFS